MQWPLLFSSGTYFIMIVSQEGGQAFCKRWEVLTELVLVGLPVWKPDYEPKKIQWYILDRLTDWLPFIGVVEIGAPCGFSGRFEDGSFSMMTKMKICNNLHWRMKMWRTQISGLLKNEYYRLKMKIAFIKLLKTEELKTCLKIVKKVKIMLWGSTIRLSSKLIKIKITAVYLLW